VRKSRQSQVLEFALAFGNNRLGARLILTSPALPVESKAASSGAPAVRQIRVTVNDAGQRLDNFLASRLKGVPRTRLYRIIRRGEVRINGSRGKPATRLVEGDMVRVPPVRVAAPRSPATIGGPLSRLQELVLFADPHILVLNKPAGVAVHGGSGISVGVIEALKRSPLAGDFLELGHRLDRNTSGCLVFARNRESLVGLHRLFRREALGVVKRYTALLLGAWPHSRTRIEAPLLRYRDAVSGKSRVRVAEEGQPSASVLETMVRYEHATLVDITLETGRMHQARAHCSHLGFPILGDAVYGHYPENRLWRARGLARPFLHASELSFPHPVFDRPMTFRAPLADDLQAVLDVLDGESTA
jgi:23S rRNA pseudouridine955/2504/2580 synthase